MVITDCGCCGGESGEWPSHRQSQGPGDMGPDTWSPATQDTRCPADVWHEAAPSFNDHQQQVHGGETGDFRLLSLAWITEHIVCVD